MGSREKGSHRIRGRLDKETGIETSTFTYIERSIFKKNAGLLFSTYYYYTKDLFSAFFSFGLNLFVVCVVSKWINHSFQTGERALDDGRSSQPHFRYGQGDERGPGR